MPQRKGSPLWDPQGSLVNPGDDEAQMVGQGLRGRIEATLECHTDDVEHCSYYRHDSCPNSGRSRPPQRQGRMGVRTLHIQTQHEVLRPDDGLEHVKILVGCLALDHGLVETTEGMNDSLLVLPWRRVNS